MVIGHNPALQVLVLRLVKPPKGAKHGGVETELDQITRKFPTGALASMSFDAEWSALAPACARLDDYVRPKQLY
jgi:phosphohistidine phosphatase SixA